MRHGDKDEKSGKRIVRGVPLLVIDDEADNASINTNPPLFDENGKVQEEYDVSAINGLIRGESLADIVASLRSLLENDPIAQEELEILLFEVGYLDIHIPQYEPIGYTPREVNYFKVEGGFPRIIEAELRNGVGDVRYTISVAECRRFSIPELDVISVISGSHE